MEDHTDDGQRDKVATPRAVTPGASRRQGGEPVPARSPNQGRRAAPLGPRDLGQGIARTSHPDLAEVDEPADGAMPPAIAASRAARMGGQR